MCDVDEVVVDNVHVVCNADKDVNGVDDVHDVDQLMYIMSIMHAI